MQSQAKKACTEPEHQRRRRRWSPGRPEAPTLLSPFQRPRGSGRKEARCWRTGSFALPRVTGSAAGLWARGLRSHGLEECWPPVPRTAPRAPEASTAPLPADGRRRRLVPAQATLPSAGAAPGAQIPPRRLKSPAGRDQHPQGRPATYSLTCSSASPRVPSPHEGCSQIINPSDM